MVRFANRNAGRTDQSVDLRVDDAQVLSSVPDASVDRIVSNYLLMDLPDHDAALRAFARVLVPNGVVVLVLLHPCFDVPEGPERSEDAVRYTWPKPYVDRWRFRSRWGEFGSDFLTFHRSLSDYWRAFQSVGFRVDDFDEPVVPRNQHDLSTDAVERARWTPYSVAFKLTRI